MPPYNIHVQIDEEYAGEIKPTVIRAAARATLQHEAAPKPTELTILITGDEYLHALNQKFLGIDGPTDVLSFPSDAPNLVAVDGGFKAKPYLGDIAISFPRALAQAEAAGHSVEAELQLLTVHGVLHLLSHDHAEQTEKEKMWAAQEAVLAGLKSPATRPPLN